MKRLLIIPVLVGTIALTACATSELASEPASAQDDYAITEQLDRIEKRLDELGFCLSSNQQAPEMDYPMSAC